MGTVVNTNIYGWGQKHIRRNKLVGTESHTNGTNRWGQNHIRTEQIGGDRITYERKLSRTDRTHKHTDRHTEVHIEVVPT